MAYEDEDSAQSEQVEAPPSQGSDQSSQSGEGEWVRDPIQAPPPEEAQPQAQAQDQGEWVRDPIQAPPPAQDEWTRDPNQRPPAAQEEKTEPESQFAAGVRSVAHSVIPSVAGAVGVGVGGVLGNLPGALIGGMAFGGAAHQAQEWLLKNLFGYDDSKIQAANREAHPWTTGAAEVAGALPAFGVTAAPMVASRLANAVITGAIDYAAGGDLQHAAGAALGGAALGNPTTLGKAAIEGGENVGKKISSLLATGKATQEEAGNILSARGATIDGAGTKPEGAGDYPPGNPADAPKPGAEVEKADVKTPGINTPGGYGGRTAAAPIEDVAIGNPGSKPTESNREGGKAALPEGTDATIESGRAPAPLGTLNPDIEAVMRPKSEEPAAPRQQAEQEQPGAPRAAAAERPAETVKSDPLVESLKQEQAKRAADAENPPSEFDQAAQKAVEAGKKYGTLGRQARQQDEAPARGGPPREPPPPTEPPEPGPKDARLNKPPLLESAPNSIGAHFRRIFAPEWMSPASDVAGGALRKGQGVMQGLNDKWTAALEKHYPAIEKLDKFGMDALTDKIEGGNSPRFKGWNMPEGLDAAITDIKAMNKEYKDAIAKHADDPDAVKAWNEEHLPHLYKNAEEIQDTMRSGGSGIRGSGGSLNARKFETYEQAKQEAGHERAHDNPLDALAAYRTELGKHIALRDAIQEMREGGHLKYGMPDKRVGASGQEGNLGSGTKHPDWAPVPGLTSQGRVAYMPRDAATVFNNHLSQGLRENPLTRVPFNFAKESFNKLTQVELGVINGFHFFVTGNEASISNMSRGISELSKGFIKDAAKSIGTAPFAAIMNYGKGLRMMSAITGDTPALFGSKTLGSKMMGENTPLMRGKITEQERMMVKAAQEAGVMPLGRSYAPDVNMSKAESFVKSYTRGSLGRELVEMGNRIKDNPLKLPAEVWDGVIGRALQTMSGPLFGHYIPALKFGGLMENARSAVKTGGWDLRTPQGHEQLVRFMRKESNAMDVRLGEMNANNAFMHKGLQDAGYVTLRSFSWAKGTATSLGGGAGGVLKAIGGGLLKGDIKGIGEKLVNKLDMNHKDYDPNLSYAIAFPFGIALMGAMYQFIKTGEMPKSPKDLYLPRSGGIIPGVGGKGDVEERARLPGYHKEILGAMHDPAQELYNKLNVGIHTGIEEFTNKDWKGQPIVRPDATVGENITDRAKFAADKLKPLFIKGVTAVPPEGSKVGTVERGLGLKQTSKQDMDPEAAQKGADARYKKAWDSSKNQEYKEQHGGRENMPKAELRKTYGTAGAPPEELTRPSTLKRAPANSEWIRDPIQRPPPQ